VNLYPVAGDGAGTNRSGCSGGRPQPRQHPEAGACTLRAFWTDMRRMNETTNETTQPYGPMTGFDVLPGQRWRRIGDSNS